VRIISRHFLASYLRLFVAILLGSLLTIAIVEMLLKFDEVVESGGLSGIASYFLLRIPSEYLRDTIPVASFAAAFLCIGGAARAREITALEAGGVSRGRVVLPIVLVSLLLSLFALAVNETVVLAAERGVSRLARARDGVSFSRGSFWYHRDDVVYNIRDADPETKTLHDVTVFRLDRGGRLLESLHAERVEVSEGTWVVNDALRRSFDPAAPEAPPRLERLDGAAVDLGGARDLALLDASIEHLSLAQLREYVAARAADGRDAVSARGRLQRRLADPWVVSLFAWLALPLGFSVERTRSLAVSGLAGIACVGVFYTLRTAVSMLAAGGVALAVPAPWALLAGFAALAAFALVRAPG
jgi:LPS export ABC transporter permease LptG